MIKFVLKVALGFVLAFLIQGLLRSGFHQLVGQGMLDVAGWTPGVRPPSDYMVISVMFALGASATWLLNPSPTRLGKIVSQIPAPKDARILFVGDVAGAAVVSPDGTMVAFVAQERGKRRQIWLRHLEQGESRALRGTERGQFPFWSPDSKSLGYQASGKL